MPETEQGKANARRTDREPGIAHNTMDMSTRFTSTTTLRQSSTRSPLRLANRPTFYAVLLVLLMGCALALTACGPAQPQSDVNSAEADTLRIAQQYQADSNLDQARAAIQDLKVANPRQYLALRAEQAILENSDPQATKALVKLAVDLKLESGTILDYATKNGLVAAAPTQLPATATPALAVAAADTPANTPAAIAAAPAVTNSEPVSATTPAAGSAIALATNTTAAPAALAIATPTQLVSTSPMAAATGLINVRSGPGVDYTVVGALQPAAQVGIVGKDAAGDWYEVQLNGGSTGWVLSQLVQTSGDVGAVTVEANIPAAPTATPAPAVVEAAPTAAAQAGTEAAPAATTAPAASPSDQPFFKLVSRRMWSKTENGACSGQHLLRINVIDANGVRINGVRLKGIYTGEVLVTGSQGKGDGIIEYDLYGSGEGFQVIQNNDGRDATSDRAEGFTTNSLDIDIPTLIQGGYCSDEADCKIFYSSWGCKGHHSWEATFQRNY